VRHGTETDATVDAAGYTAALTMATTQSVLYATTLEPQPGTGDDVTLTIDVGGKLAEGSVELIARVEIDDEHQGVVRGGALELSPGAAPTRTLRFHTPTGTQRIWVGVFIQGRGQVVLSRAHVVRAASTVVTYAGTIVDETGHPLRAATVAITRPGFETVRAWALTDAEGRYQFPLPRDEYELAVTSSDHAPVSTTLAAEPTGPLELRVAASTDLVRGTVETRGSAPNASALVSVQSLDGATHFTFAPTGTFTVALPAGEYDFFIEDDAAVQQGVTATSPGTVVVRAQLPSALVSDAPLAALAAELVPLTTGFPDRVVASIARHPIVMFGEPTHDTAEAFQLRAPLFHKLVLAHDFRALVVEAGWAEMLAVDDYVIDGRGDLNAALLGTHFWNVQTEELRELIEWIRHHNAALPPARRVHVLGADLQYSDTTLTIVNGMLERAKSACRVDPGELGALTIERAAFVFAGSDPAIKARAHQALQTLAACVKRDAKPLARALGSDYPRLTVATAMLLNSAELLALPLRERISVRDRMMADVVERISREMGGKGILVGLHNAHTQYGNWGRDYDATGQHLRARRGAAVYVINMVVDGGSFLAFDSRHGRMISPDKAHIDLPAAPDRSLAAHLRTASGAATATFLDMASASAATQAWLREWHLFREAGCCHSSLRDLEIARIPYDTADALLFIRQSTPIKLLPGATRGP